MQFSLLRYVNEEKKPIEAVYMFPVEEECAVVNFSAEVDGRIIKTKQCRLEFLAGPCLSGYHNGMTR